MAKRKKSPPKQNNPDILLALMHCKGGGPMRDRRERRAKEQRDWRHADDS